MTEPRHDDGDPYAPEERRPPRIPVWTWGILGLATLGGAAYALTPRQWTPVPVLNEQKTVTFPAHPWAGYQPTPAKAELRPAVYEPDRRVDALQQQLKAQQEEILRQREALQELRNKPVPQAPPAAKAPGTGPVAKAGAPRHRDMGALFFPQAEEKGEEEPLYTLAPGSSKISCVVEAKQNSDVQSVGTLIVTANVFDSLSHRRLLIPQGSVILATYKSNSLVYGNQRLPEYSTILTLPNGTTKELNDEPVMDQVGQAGLVSSVDQHYLRSLSAVLVQGVLRGSQASISTTNPLAGGIANSTAQYGQRIAQPYVDTRPTLLVEPGEECLVILTRTIKLPEYKEKSR